MCIGRPGLCRRSLGIPTSGIVDHFGMVPLVGGQNGQHLGASRWTGENE